MPHDPRYCTCPFCGPNRPWVNTTWVNTTWGGTYTVSYSSNYYTTPPLRLDAVDTRPFVKIGGRPPAPAELEIAASAIDETLMLWLPPNARIEPQKRRGRRAPRQPARFSRYRKRAR